MSNKKAKIEWTPMQKLAIAEKDKTLLVSAAAGSGKTATLTQRIIKRITEDDADISRMLIVTFTRASAADLRLKIYKAISEALAKNPLNRHLSLQLTKLNNAKICTIDSFYFDIIKSNFTEAGVSPSFRIIDEGEYKLIAKRAMNDAIEDLYETDPNFPLFIECFASIRSSKNVVETFLSIYSSLSTVPTGIEYINECAKPLYEQADLDFYQTDCGKLLKETTENFFIHYKSLLEYALDIISNDDFVQEKYGAQLYEDLSFTQNILDSIHAENCTYTTIKESLESFSHSKMGTVSASHKTEESVLAKAIRDEFKDKKEDHYKKYYLSSQETLHKVMKETADHTATLYSLLKNFQSRLDIQKQKLNFLTFSDISRKTYSILIKNGKPTELAKKISLEYDDIYIDEYQDVDYLQDEIFSAIATPTNRFMVGDIKQSIYKFRGAEPSLFSKYRNKFPNISDSKNSNTATIFMSDNFRCDKNIIEFTNLICSNIFKAAGGCVSYVDGDNLVYSKGEKDTVDDKHISVNIIHVPKKSTLSSHDDNTDDEEDFIALEWESEFIASQIESLIGKEKNNDESLIKAGDIAVLFRSKSISPHLSAALYRRNIKVSEADSTKYFENDDVLMMLCILNSIDNPERDIYLAGTLRSPLFNFSADELFLLRNQYAEPYSLFGALCAYMNEHDDALSQKSKIFCEKLSYWQENATALSIDRFLLMLFNDDMIIASGIISNQNDDGDGGNLLLLYEYARSFNQNGFSSLYEFIEYINSLIEEDQSLPETTKSTSPNRVSLMSIHKSKGLEFPVCFLSYAGKAFSTEEAKQNLILNYPFGIAMKLADQSGFALLDTPMRQILLAKTLQTNTEEEIRTLYVALTRARERLYIVGTTQSQQEKLELKAKINSICHDSYATLCASKSYIDWILVALQRIHPEYVDINFMSPADITISLDKKNQENDISTDIDEDLYAKLSESFKFNYEYQELSRIPTKLSVSRLYPDVLDENDTSLNLFTDEKSANIPAFFSKEKPHISATKRGTATHLFFQFCNFDYAAVHGINEELNRLCQLKYLPENTPELIYKEELDKFLESDLIKQIFSAKEVIREQRFNISLPIENFTKNVDLISKMKHEKLAVQGVIDLILIDRNNNIRLYDYKTDRLTKAELNDPLQAKLRLNKAHANQLSYYAKAIEAMFGRKCESIQVYSTHSGILYDIDISNLSEDII